MHAVRVADQRVTGPSPLPPAEPADGFAPDAAPAQLARAVLQRLDRGRELACARSYEMHWHGVTRLLTRVLGGPDEAGDVAQEVFVQLYRKPPAALTDTLGEASVGTPL